MKNDCIWGEASLEEDKLLCSSLPLIKATSSAMKKWLYKKGGLIRGVLLYMTIDLYLEDD